MCKCKGGGGLIYLRTPYRGNLHRSVPVPRPPLASRALCSCARSEERPRLHGKAAACLCNKWKGQLEETVEIKSIWQGKPHFDDLGKKAINRKMAVTHRCGAFAPPPPRFCFFTATKLNDGKNASQSAGEPCTDSTDTSGQQLSAGSHPPPL